MKLSVFNIFILSLSENAITAARRSHRDRRLHQLPPQRFNEFVDLSPEVRNALNQKAPIVALESTIITHGMPYPHNLHTARNVEAVVRRQVSVPVFLCVGQCTPTICSECYEFPPFLIVSPVPVPDQNAVPATIAIINGRIKVGLTDAELTMLADTATSATVGVGVDDTSDGSGNGNRPRQVIR